ncbi:hypothetical protein CERSUDRAFT_113235 [Gelatoporia subvermispora B]|uniref:Uncharacterized protein n=1 Tax=Ceriporiopsis subvermispora (strain B) TaxID=914234 RepID=M2PNT5_CERS8|nr:hypothetical protein CERSUDRAFT_113235 [Gelatoporia subvermispora B]
MHRLSTEDIAQARKACEDEISDLRGKIVHVKRRLNSLTLVHRLPDEILALIFHSTKEATEPHHDWEDIPDLVIPAHFYRWIRISHICHHWRAVALSYPRLWNRVFVANLTWVTELLGRSGNTPLFVDVHTRARKGLQKRIGIAQKVFAQMNRVQELDIAIHIRDLESLIQYLNYPAPRLRKLKLCVILRFEENGPGFTAPLFQMHHPRLEYLSLLNTIGLSWSSTLFCSSLTELFWSCDENSQDVNIQDLRSAFRGMPNLRRVELHNVIPTQMPEAFSNVRDIITMPSLQFLKMSASPFSPEHCMRILVHFLLPALNEIWIECTEARGAEALVDYLASYLRRMDLLRAYSLTVRPASYGGLISVQTRTDLHPDDHSLTYEVPRCLYLHMYASTVQEVIDIGLQMCRSWPLASVEAFDADAEPFETIHWRDVLSRMPAITYLQLEDDPHDCLLEALQVYDPQSGPEEGTDLISDVLLPKLHTLSFHDAAFVKFVPNPPNRPPHPEEALVKCINDRLDHGCGIRKLIMQKCGFRRREILDELDDKVQKLQITRYELWAESDFDE